jgi:AcrR family transcriptional regulator
MNSTATKRILGDSERERILRSMAELCAERGYRETTIEAVVQRADSSAEAFQKLFGGLEECMVAAMNAITAQVLAETSAVYSADRSEWESGMLGIKAILELMAAYPNFAYLSYVGARQMAPAQARQVYRTGIHILAMMIERLWEYSDLDLQPEAAAKAVLGGCEAVARREIVAGRADRLPSLLPDFVYAATVSFLGQEEAMRLARRGRELLVGSGWEV